MNGKKKRKNERIVFTTTELSNKIDTLAEISMEGCRGNPEPSVPAAHSKHTIINNPL